jgi:hypothetical protein
MKLRATRKALFGDSTMVYPTIGIGALSRPYPSYAVAMRWRSLTPGGKQPDLKARALQARASRRATKQEPR